MPKGDKYIVFQKYLEQCSQNEFTLTFAEIATILNMSRLPESAYTHSACWNNGGHNSFSLSWFYAGYDAHANMNENKVTFIKKEHPSATSTGGYQGQHHTYIASLDINVAQAAIQSYHATTTDGSHTRYRSWAHCYNAFQKHWMDDDQIEFLCLHLAVYLASWGMLRNSFLLQFDYLIHRPIISVLCTSRFSSLFGRPEEPQIDLTIQAAEVIKVGYPQKNISDTLITKILLGIFGCVPAFDRYFKNAVRQYHICAGQFSCRSLGALWQYYDTNRDAFESLRRTLLIDGMPYPPMKLLDMCCWQLGYETDDENKRNELE